jgi:DNA modification methylase
MTHLSENSKRLQEHTTVAFQLQELGNLDNEEPKVYLFHLPSGRTDQDASRAQSAFHQIADFCARSNEESTICILTTPPDVARLQPYLESSLRFQLWVAIKTTSSRNTQNGQLQARHVALLVLTRYQGSLRHTKTRIKYSYCPACGKTTKDYGGKKHLYHEYGTLVSDVWRDIVIDASGDISPVVDRLCDLFGVEPYTALEVIDLTKCADLVPQPETRTALEQRALFQLPTEAIPPSRSQLVNGDCLQVLKSIPDSSVDFCFADPPYNLEKKYDGYNDALELREYFAWCDEWLSELARVLKPGRTCAILNIPLWAIRHYQHLASILKYQAWIVWDALGFPVRMIMPSHYSILCFSKGGPRPLPGLYDAERTLLEKESLSPLAEFFCSRSSCISERHKNGINDKGELTDLWYDIHRLKHNSRRVDHPCQLPPTLMHRLISLFTNPGEVVLDCFNGAGTSTLTAQQLGREYIGIELSEQYHKLALQRHKELSQGIDPFGKKDTIPTAKNSPVPRLPKQVYQVSKKVLQLDVKRIAQQLGRLPTHAEVETLGKYPIEYFDNYFVSWGEVCAAARTTGMSELPLDESQEMQLALFANDTSQATNYAIPVSQILRTNEPSHAKNYMNTSRKVSVSVTDNGKAYHIVPNPNGGWDVKKSGADRAIRHFDRKSDAVKYGRRVSQNQRTELIVHKVNGTIHSPERSRS